MNLTKISSFFLVFLFFLFNPKYSLSTGGDSDWGDFDNSAVESSAMSEYDPDGDERYSKIIGTLLPSSKTESGKEEVSEKDKEVLRLSAEIKELSSTVKYLMNKEKREQIENRKSRSEYKSELDNATKKILFEQIQSAMTYNRGSNKEFLKMKIFEFKKHINMQDQNGDTLLHIAIQLKDLKVIKYLIYNGADYNIKNILGRTPADLVKVIRASLKEKDADAGVKKENKALVSYWHKKVIKKEDINFDDQELTKFQQLKDKFAKQISNFKKLTSSKLSKSSEN